MSSSARLDRRRFGGVLLGVCGALSGLGASKPEEAWAFGEEGVFHPRVLLTGTSAWEGARVSAPARWSYELMRRTSAPARVTPSTVHADEPELLDEPFVIWGGSRDPGALAPREVVGLRQFLALGGTLFVDDFEPGEGSFGRGAKRELGRVLPDSSPVVLGKDHVVLRSFYLLRRTRGRVEGPPQLEAIVRSGLAQVLFSSHDLLGALARSPGGGGGLHPRARRRGAA